MEIDKIHNPNEGRSLEAAQTMRRSESQNDFRARLGIDTSAQIRLVKISHMVYQHSDIDSIVTFLHGESAHDPLSRCIRAEEGGSANRASREQS